MSRARCYGNEHKVTHAKNCRRGRPLCKWRRKTNPKRRVCFCDAYHFPHRDGSGACRIGIPFALTKKAS